LDDSRRLVRLQFCRALPKTFVCLVANLRYQLAFNFFRQDWIMMGEKKNSYIPSRPDEYYTRTGEWISWVSTKS
jgi:hypothetical protein